MKGEFEAALKLHKAHLSFAQELGDHAALGRAYGNMGNAYHALGLYDQAVRYHRQELQISLEVTVCFVLIDSVCIHRNTKGSMSPFCYR